MKYDNRKKADKLIRSSAAEYLTYVAAAGENGVELRYEDENIWLTQKMLSALYGVSISAINQHIKKIYEDKELEEKSTIKNFLIVQDEGNRKISRNVIHYNLQMIIAVGFKVDNERAIQFRKWANQIVKDFTIKGWVMDDERLKNDGSILTKKYFEEQLERIREIRMSERKLQIFMQRLLTMIKQQKRQLDFFHLSKTNYIMLFLETLLQKLYIIEQIAKKKIWD